MRRLPKFGWDARRRIPRHRLEPRPRQAIDDVAAAPVARDILLQARHDGFPPRTACSENQQSLIEAQRMRLPPADPAILSGGTARP